MGFQSVGDRANGRIFPGKHIAIGMLTNVLVELGYAREEETMRIHPFQSHSRSIGSAATVVH
jgi:hypothetical protein